MYFDRDIFFAHLKTEKIGRESLFFKKTDSTNLKARKMIERPDLKDGTILIAGTQTKGVGRFERDWISPYGGLWFTIIIKYDRDIKNIEKVNLIIANSIIKALKNYITSGLKVKWPNDIYLKELKMGGILSELILNKEKKSHLIIGVGLNINNKRDTLGKYKQISISAIDAINKKICREKLLAEILNDFEKDFYYYFISGDLDSVIKEIKDILFF